MQAKPNIVFVLTDDQGIGDLRCLGNEHINTPHIDALYEESIRLTNYHVGPTCAPTRAGLLTGHYANSTGVWHTIGGRSLLRKDEISMADILRENGYRTGIFGKWHLGDNYPYRPQDRGFDDVIIHGGGGIGQTNDYWGNDYFDDTYATNGEYKGFEGYCTDVWFQEGIDFIRTNKDRPFFCYLPTNAPHSPFRVPPEYSQPYLDKMPEIRANYYGMITCIDHNIDILRNELEALGISENTIFIFSTDNGTDGGVEVDSNQFVISGHNGGFRGKKNSEYDGGHRVPFFIYWPDGGLNKGLDVEELTANIDVLPTLMDLCGIEQDERHDFDGKSIAPLLLNEKVDWSERVIVTDSQRLVSPLKWRKSSVMTNRWRLVNGFELYDMESDPKQVHDVAENHPDIVQWLQNEYEVWWQKVSRQFDQEIPIPIGSKEVQDVLLTTHDWRNSEGHCAWNQGMIREGEICNGYWEIEVETSGKYLFELRRWPKQEERAITEGIPGEVIDWYNGGRAIPVKSAFIKIGNIEKTIPVKDDMEEVRFILDLEKSCAHLQTWFLGNDDFNLGAYYVYIKRL